MTMPVIFLRKAIIPGGSHADLFSVTVPVHGYTTKDGTYVAPHQAERHKHVAAPVNAPDQPAPPPIIVLPAPKPVAQPVALSHPASTERHQAGGIGKGAGMIQITPSQSGKGFYLKLLSGAANLAPAFRAAFPSASFYADSGKFYLVGKTAKARLEKWAAEQAGALAEITEAAQRAADEVVAAKRAAADADAALGPLLFRNVDVRPAGSNLAVRFPYNPSAVAAIKAVPGARFDADTKQWLVPAINRPALRAAATTIDGIFTTAAEAKAVADAARAADPVEESPKSRRWPVLLANGARVGTVLRLSGRPVVVESMGKPFRVGDDMPSLYGHLMGHEGESVAYAYYRDATIDEAAAVDARDAAELGRKQARTDANNLLSGVKTAFRAASVTPDGPMPWPKGETLLQDGQRSAAYGGGEEWLLDTDGALWHLIGNGADGSDWSMNNIPGTIGSRMTGPDAVDLADKLRLVAILRERAR